MERWDTICGFVEGDEVHVARRAEDAAALAVLDATPVWLDFVEHSYLERRRLAAPDGRSSTRSRRRSRPRADGGVRAVRAREPGSRLHARRGDARQGRARRRDRWFCYEDIGYKHIPGLLAWRVSRLFHRGLWPTPAAVPVDPDHVRKQAAVDCYPSQLLALEADWQIAAKLDAPAPEQYWRLAAPPPGMGRPLGAPEATRRIAVHPRRHHAVRSRRRASSACRSTRSSAAPGSPTTPGSTACGASTTSSRCTATGPASASRAMTTLAALSGHTSRARLGLLVTGMTYRHPGGLRRRGDHDRPRVRRPARARRTAPRGSTREHRALGIPFPPTGERVDAFEEAVQIVRGLLTTDGFTFEGAALPGRATRRSTRVRCSSRTRRSGSGRRASSA